jgi:hypothetical protein
LGRLAPAGSQQLAAGAPSSARTKKDSGMANPIAFAAISAEM